MSDAQSRHGPREMVLEFGGELHKEDIVTILDQLKVDGGINRFSIGISVSETSLPTLMAGVTEREEGEPAETSQPEAPSSSAESGEKRAPSLRPTGDPFEVAMVLNTHDDWMTTDALRDELSETADVNLKNLGTVLWTLADRDLIEKRPLESDRRKSEYRITSMGKTVVVNAKNESSEAESATS